MNLILEIPDTTEKEHMWAIACQIRDLRHVRNVVCVDRDMTSSYSGFAEIWIESDELEGSENDEQSTIRLLAMIVRDWVVSGARLHLRGDVVIDI